MILLEVEPLDLGQDVRAVGLDLTEGADREPVRGENAARVWSLALPSVAGKEPWALDFFSHLKRVREFCQFHGVEFREASERCVVIPSIAQEALEELFQRFEGETFGMRSGARLESVDSALENDLARKGVDAYHRAYPAYSFCAVCNFEDGSAVVLSDSLWASEILRRVKPALSGESDVQVRLAT
jgi:hypothetical protein